MMSGFELVGLTDFAKLEKGLRLHNQQIHGLSAASGISDRGCLDQDTKGVKRNRPQMPAPFDGIGRYSLADKEWHYQNHRKKNGLFQVQAGFFFDMMLIT